MRRSVSALLSLLLLGAALTGCSKPAPPAPAPAPDTPPSQAPPQTAPLPLAGPCTPGTTAMDLPSDPYGGGIALKPPEPAGSPDRPWLGYLSADQLDLRPDGSGSMAGTVYMRHGGSATVDAGEFVLRGFLMPAPSPGWFETHVKVEGVEPAEKNVSTIGDHGHFDLRIPAGRPGDAFRLTLTDTLNGDVTFTFCRQSPPKAALERRGTKPLVMTLAFTNDMLRESVERSLTGPHDKEGGSQGDWIAAMKWLDPRTLELTARQPAPPVMRINLRGAQDRNGLFVTGGVPNVYSGEPPRVVAVDPVTGQASAPLAEVPLEPNGASLSPDGTLLRVTAWQMYGGQDIPNWQQVLVDLITGQTKPLKPEELYGQWVPGGDTLWVRPNDENSLALIRWTPAGPQQVEISDLPAYDSFELSPDGRLIAVLARTGGEAPYPYVPVRFLIVNSDGKTRTPLTGEALMYRPGKDGLRLYGPAWSPDGTRIALTQPDGKGGTALVVADLAVGALRKLAPSLPGSQGSTDSVTWSPDGRRLLVGPLLLDAATGKIERHIEGMVGRPFWSRDGAWLLFQPDDWTEITAYNLSTGQAVALGEGLAVGWRPDGKAMIIRWPDARHRVMWGY
ncbi:MAG TPA: hypothetical protein VD969_16125 [Symbiobacteriaceae bacterium]|nr:hypothetical protein [Symbiobacteriaceae bacterium]